MLPRTKNPSQAPERKVHAHGHWCPHRGHVRHAIRPHVDAGAVLHSCAPEPGVHGLANCQWSPSLSRRMTAGAHSEAARGALFHETQLTVPRPPSTPPNVLYGVQSAFRLLSAVALLPLAIIRRLRGYYSGIHRRCEHVSHRCIRTCAGADTCVRSTKLFVSGMSTCLDRWIGVQQGVRRIVRAEPWAKITITLMYPWRGENEPIGSSANHLNGKEASLRFS
jgi:hypothetical protein